MASQWLARDPIGGIVDWVEVLYRHPLIGIPVAAVLVIGVIWVGRLWWLGRSENRREVSGTARVLSLAKSAADQRGRRMCRIELEVNIPGCAPYATRTEQQIAPDDLAAVQQGMTVPVRADPENPRSIRIDFSQPIT